MPDVILDIDGWTKVHHVSKLTYEMGFVRILFPRPLSLMVSSCDVTTTTYAYADFHRTRHSVNGMPVWKEINSGD